MEREAPAAVATTFLERFCDGEFDAADALVHPEGPLEGAGDAATLFSLLATDFLATLVLGAIPTSVTEATTIEEGPTAASVDASLDVAGVVELDALVELRPREDESGRDTDDERGSGGGRDSSDGGDLDDRRDVGDGRRDGWSVWNVDVSS